MFTCVQIPHFSVVEILVKHCSLYNKVLYNIIQPLKITNFQRNRTEKKCVFALFQTLCKVAVLLTYCRCFYVRHGCLSSQIACYEDMWTIYAYCYSSYFVSFKIHKNGILVSGMGGRIIKEACVTRFINFKQWELPPN